jgi:hypothetical protein
MFYKALFFRERLEIFWIPASLGLDGVYVRLYVMFSALRCMLQTIGTLAFSGSNSARVATQELDLLQAQSPQNRENAT